MGVWKPGARHNNANTNANANTAHLFMQNKSTCYSLIITLSFYNTSKLQ